MTFLASRIKPNYGFLHQKLGVDTDHQVIEKVKSQIANFDFKKLADDVAPFLINQNETKRVEKFQEFWEQVNLG